MNSKNGSSTISLIDKANIPGKSNLSTGTRRRSVHSTWQMDEDNKSALLSSAIALPSSESRRRGVMKKCHSAWELDVSGSFSAAHTSALPTNTNFEEHNTKKRSSKKKRSALPRRTKSMQNLKKMSSQGKDSEKSINDESSKTRRKKKDTIKKMKDTVDMFDQFEQLLHVNDHGECSVSDISEKSEIPKNQQQDIPPTLEIAMKISRRNLMAEACDEDVDECDESTSFHDSGESKPIVPQEEEPWVDLETRRSNNTMEMSELSLQLDDAESGNDVLMTSGRNQEDNGKIRFKRTHSSSFGSDPEKTPLFFFEANRSASVDRKITLSVIFLRAYAVVLHEGAEEVERVESLVEGTARANLAYSSAMKSVLENTLGYQSPGIEGGDVSSRSYGSTVSTLSCKSFQDPLASLFDSQSMIADQFSDNANHALSSSLQELSKLRKEAKDRFQYIEDIGDALMSKLESIEEDVKKAWQLYNGAAVAASSTQRSTRDESDFSLNQSKDLSNNDLWLLEMRYHVAVAYQESLWRKIAAELSKILLAGRQGEQERRGRLQALLLDFVSKQKRLMPACSSTHPQILQELLDRNDQEVEIDITNTLKSHVDRFQRWESECLVDFSLGLLQQEKEAFASLETLECPLSSKLVTACAFVDRKVRGALGGTKWQTMMAVHTEDKFFHLFAVPQSVDKDTDLQSTFLELLPEAQLPSLAGEVKPNAKNADVSLRITPTESFFLSDCNVSIEHECRMSGILKINEEHQEANQALPRSARNFFQKSNKQEVEIRADYFHNRDEWRSFRDTVFCGDCAGRENEVQSKVLVQ